MQILTHHMKGVRSSPGVSLHLEIHTKGVIVDELFLLLEVNMEILARGTPGFSGADLENMVNQVISS